MVVECGMGNALASGNEPLVCRVHSSHPRTRGRTRPSVGTTEATATRMPTENTTIAAPDAAPTHGVGITLEHRRILEHVGQDHEADVAPTDVDGFQRRHLAIARCVRDFLHVAVHVVFCRNQLATIQLTALHLYRHNVSFGLMKDLHGNSNAHQKRKENRNKKRQSITQQTIMDTQLC